MLTGALAVKCLHLHTPPCRPVSAFLGFFASSGLIFWGTGRCWGCLAHWKPTAVTDNSFFTHTRKQTVRKCTDTRTGTQKTHTLRQMVRIRPLLNFPFRVHASALPRQTLGHVFMSSLQTRDRFRCDRQGWLVSQIEGCYPKKIKL